MKLNDILFLAQEKFWKMIEPQASFERPDSPGEKLRIVPPLPITVKGIPESVSYYLEAGLVARNNQVIYSIAIVCDDLNYREFLASYPERITSQRVASWYMKQIEALESILDKMYDIGTGRMAGGNK